MLLLLLLLLFWNNSVVVMRLVNVLGALGRCFFGAGYDCRSSCARRRWIHTNNNNNNNSNHQRNSNSNNNQLLMRMIVIKNKKPISMKSVAKSESSLIDDEDGVKSKQANQTKKNRNKLTQSVKNSHVRKTVM